MSDYLHDHIENKARQDQAIPGSSPNNAGGQSFAVDDWKRLERFLILGAEAGTYYVDQRSLIDQNLASVERCIVEDGKRAVNMTVTISSAGRAKDNDPALLVMAMAAAAKDQLVRAYAFDNLPHVARIGTHLFHFARFMQTKRGWGRGARNAIASWYTAPMVDRLARDMVKYRQRDGWSHRDLLRLAHPVPHDDDPEAEARAALFDWATKGGMDAALPEVVVAHCQAMEGSPEKSVALIQAHGLTREMVPPQHLGDPAVWDALAEKMPLHATIRSLGKLSSLGLMAKHGDTIRERLGNSEALQKARVHPLAILQAMRQYDVGHGDKGSLSWTPEPSITRALDDAFYLAFPNHQGSGKRVLIALDVSASMNSPNIAGTFLSPREASAAMTLVFMATEPQCDVVCFTSARDNLMAAQEGWRSSGLISAPFEKNSTLKQAIESTSRLPHGGTDCALPIQYAAETKRPYDAFVVLTDSETWAGRYHPSEALKGYRSLMGIDAKMAVVGMVSNGFSIADPNDGGMLDVVGFDTATPQLIADFFRD